MIAVDVPRLGTVKVAAASDAAAGAEGAIALRPEKIVLAGAPETPRPTTTFAARCPTSCTTATSPSTS